jgi:hypothetical protein
MSVSAIGEMRMGPAYRTVAGTINAAPQPSLNRVASSEPPVASPAL